MGFDYADKIRALIANANDENLSDEARASYQAKAEELMVKYRIAEEEALATDPGSTKPVWKTLVVLGEWDYEMSGWYTTALGCIASHTGCRIRVFVGEHDETLCNIVGYEGDVRYAEFLWTAVLLTFNTRINPKYDAALPEAENVYRLRNAGLERRVIADAVWGRGAGAQASNRSKIQRMYLKECARRGETPRATGLSHDTKTYRDAYARTFVGRLNSRLLAARDAVDSTGGGVVMFGREDRVNEAFYERYPNLRPGTRTYVQPEPCKRCTPDKACRTHRVSARDIADYRRRYESASARAGAHNGRSAADDVNLVRGTTSAHRAEGNTVEAIGS